MKLVLRLTIVCSVASEEGKIIDEPHIYLLKTLELPFTPYDVLVLNLSSIGQEDSDYESFSDLYQKSTELITFFKIECLHYDVSERVFRGISYLESQRKDGMRPHFRTLEEGKTLGHLLIIGYGFSPQFNRDRKILDLPTEP